MSLPTRERGLKQELEGLKHRDYTSLPTRERGLKRYRDLVVSGVVVSLPTRERGLKLAKCCDDWAREKVAPHAGAWIETAYCVTGHPLMRCRSPRGSVD